MTTELSTLEAGIVQTDNGADGAGSAPAQPSRPGFLDRPITSLIRLDWEVGIWIVIFVVGAIARLVMLDARGMSHDESLHSLYAYYLYANGNYDHNPMMHGPFRYHVTAFIYFLFGDSDYTARLAPALFGLGVIWMVYQLRVYLGRLGAILAGVMVTISPSLLFHSRYIRDDIFMAFFTLVWIYGAFRYLDLRRMRYLVIMVAGMAFGFATMENHFIHGAIIGSFFVGLALWEIVGHRWLALMVAPLALAGSVWWVLHEQQQNQWALIALAIGVVLALIPFVLGMRGHWRLLRESTAADLAVIMVTLVLPFLAAFLHVFTGGDPAVFSNAADYTGSDMIVRLSIFVAICILASVGIGWFWFWRRSASERWRPTLKHWALLMGFFWLVQVLFYTTFFTNAVQGLATGVVGSLGYWIAQQGVKRGNQPIYYYVLIGWLYEFLPAFLSLCGIGTIVYNLWKPAQDGPWQPVAAVDVPRQAAPPEVAAAYGESLARNRVYFVVFLIWWTLGAWIGYSVAGEKMPWLLTHMALPMCVLGGWWLGNMMRHVNWQAAWRQRTWALVFAVPALALLLVIMWVAQTPSAGAEPDMPRRLLQWLLIFLALGGVLFAGAFGVVRAGAKQGVRLVTLGLVAILFVLTIRTTFMLNYINYDMATEFLVYAHAGPDVKRALAEIDTISQRTVGDRNITVAYDDESSWPLSWYMRQYPNAKFYGNNPTQDAMSAPVVIVGPNNRSKVEPYMARDYVKRTYRLIWWPEMDYFNLTPDRILGALTDPVQRERLFDIIAFRKYKDTTDPSKWQDLAQWPYRHEFDMYVRRDLAAQIWDLNVVPTANQAATNAPVIAPDQIQTVAATQIYDSPYGNMALKAPRAVAVGPNRERVIADSGNNRIVVLDADGKFVRAFGSYCNLADASTPCVDPDGDGPLAKGDGQFYEPWGVAVDQKGNIYVADTWNGRIQVFDAAGNFLRKWGTFAIAQAEGGDPNSLFGPRGLAFDLDGNLVVADTGNKRIIRFTSSGEYVDQVGGGGVVAGRFEEPTDVAVDPTDGSILVADAWNQRVQRLGSDLRYQSEFAVPGWAGRDIYQKPYLAVAADGTIYTTDPGTAQVVTFDRDGKVRSAFGGPGTEATQIGMPNGIAIDLAGASVLVADGVNNRIMVFPE